MAMLLIFEKKKGNDITSHFAGLSIHRNHFQITYYAGIFMAVIWVNYFVKYFKEKALPEFAKLTGVSPAGGV